METRSLLAGDLGDNVLPPPLGVPVVGIVAVDPVASENPANSATNAPAVDPARFVIRREGSLAHSLVVEYAVDGTATPGADYHALSGRAEIPAGRASIEIIVRPIDDAEVEEVETVRLTLAPSDTFAIATGRGVAEATIRSDDPRDPPPPPKPTVSIRAVDPTAAETAGDEAPNPGRFIVTRGGPTDAALLVHLNIGGTATNGSDYETIGETVEIPSGSTSAEINVNVIDDADIEELESVRVAIASRDTYTFPPVEPLAGTDPNAAGMLNANVGADFREPGVAVVTIRSNDVPPPPPPLPRVTIRTVDGIAAETTGDQTANPGRMVVSRTGSTDTALVVHLAIGGTATAGSDYDVIADTLEIPAGSRSAEIEVNAIDDSDAEPPETVKVSIVPDAAYETPPLSDHDPNAAPGDTRPDATGVLPLPNMAVVTILSNDEPPPPPPTTVSIRAVDAQAAETTGDATPNTARFVISRTGATDAALTVPIVIDGSATNGVDYESIDSSAEIPANASSVEIEVVPIDDDEVEGPETVRVSLQSPAASDANAAGLHRDGQSADVVIFDNDVQPPQPVVSLRTVDSIAIEPSADRDADTGRIVLHRSGPTDAALVVHLEISGRATNGVDFETIGETIEIPAGASSTEIVVRPLADKEAERVETVRFAVAAGDGYAVRRGGDVGTVHILDPLKRLPPRPVPGNGDPRPGNRPVANRAAVDAALERARVQPNAASNVLRVVRAARAVDEALVALRTRR